MRGTGSDQVSGMSQVPLPKVAEARFTLRQVGLLVECFYHDKGFSGKVVLAVKQCRGVRVGPKLQGGSAAGVQAAAADAAKGWLRAGALAPAELRWHRH